LYVLLRENQIEKVRSLEKMRTVAESEGNDPFSGLGQMIGSLLRAYYGAASQSLLEDFSQFNLSTTVHEKMQAPALPLMVDRQ
jgi:hypothetical protein